MPHGNQNVPPNNPWGHGNRSPPDFSINLIHGFSRFKRFLPGRSSSGFVIFLIFSLIGLLIWTSLYTTFQIS